MAKRAKRSHNDLSTRAASFRLDMRSGELKAAHVRRMGLLLEHLQAYFGGSLRALNAAIPSTVVR